MNAKKYAVDWDSRVIQKRLESMGSRLEASSMDLAQLARGIEMINEEMLGPRSSPRTMTRLPARLLRDLSVDGGLETCLRCVFEREMVEVVLGTVVEKEARLRLLSSIAAALRSAGLLKAPRLALDASLSSPQRDLAAKLARGLGAELVLRNHEHATHILCRHPELDADGEVEIHENKQSSHVVQGSFIRVLAKDKDQVLVHWWYTPDSSDEWIAADAVHGNLDNYDDDDDEWTKPLDQPKKPWRIALRYLLDANKYNEWGYEPDYVLPSSETDREANAATIEEEDLNDNEQMDTSDVMTSDDLMHNANSGTSNSIKKRKRQDSNNVIPPSRDDDIEHSLRAKRHVAIANIQFPPSNEVYDTVLDVPIRTISRLQSSDEDIPIELSTQQRNGNGRRVGISPTVITNIEKLCLPEWFRGTDRIKTQRKYLELRNWLIELYKKNPDQLLTSTFCRRSLGIDASAAIRLFDFLQSAGYINYKFSSQAKRYKMTGLGPLADQDISTPPEWSNEQQIKLAQAADQANGNWKSVATSVDSNFEAVDCATRMVNLPLTPGHQPPDLGQPPNPPNNTKFVLQTLLEARLDRLESRIDDLCKNDISLDDEREIITRERELLRSGYAAPFPTPASPLLTTNTKPEEEATAQVKQEPPVASV